MYSALKPNNHLLLRGAFIIKHLRLLGQGIAVCLAVEHQKRLVIVMDHIRRAYLHTKARIMLLPPIDHIHYHKRRLFQFDHMMLIAFIKVGVHTVGNKAAKIVGTVLAEERVKSGHGAAPPT